MMGEESSSRDNLEATSSTQQDTQDTSGVDTGETGTSFLKFNRKKTRMTTSVKAKHYLRSTNLSKIYFKQVEHT